MRAIIWTVVGVIVVVAVVMLIHLKGREAKSNPPPTATEIKRDIDRFNKNADEYAAQIKKLRETLGAQLTDEKKTKLAQADSIIAQVRADAGKLTALKGNELFKAKRGLTSMQQKVYDILRHDLGKK